MCIHSLNKFICREFFRENLRINFHQKQQSKYRVYTLNTELNTRYEIPNLEYGFWKCALLNRTNLNKRFYYRLFAYEMQNMTIDYICMVVFVVCIVYRCRLISPHEVICHTDGMRIQMISNTKTKLLDFLHSQSILPFAMKSIRTE